MRNNQPVNVLDPEFFNMHRINNTTTNNTILLPTLYNYVRRQSTM